ncbi:unnamed protein product [Hermetia illucens]|uniref:RRM domain-containing protein n=1 Tax=Hermetia illucens TaxID=343691 RepID=A0A7R8UFE6_HERIL|nr:unnamed protein product [Hermetia illucens]
MYSQYGQFSGEARNGRNNFQRTAVRTNSSKSLSGNTTQKVYGSANGSQSSIFTGSFHRPGPSTSSRNLVYKPVASTAGNVSVNTLKRRYEPEDTMDDTAPKRSKSSTISFDAVPQVILRKSCTVELRGIPKWMNTIAQLGSHFSEYGRIMDITVEYQADPGAATVTFSNQAEASIAHRSTTIGLGNGSWSFKAPNTTRNNRMEVSKMLPQETAHRTFIRKEENKNDCLQRRKRELLDGCCKQLETLKAILAKCRPNDPRREEKLNMIKQLMSSLKSIQDAVSLGVQIQEKQTSDRAEMQLELEAASLNQLSDSNIISSANCGSIGSLSGECRATNDNNLLRNTDNGAVQKLNSLNNTMKVDETGTQGKIEVVVNGRIEESAIAHNKVAAVRDMPTVDELNNQSSMSSAIAHVNNSLGNESLLDCSSLDYEWEYPDLSGNWSEN